MPRSRTPSSARIATHGLLPALLLVTTAASCHLDARGLTGVVPPGTSVPGDGENPPPPTGPKWGVDAAPRPTVLPDGGAAPDGAGRTIDDAGGVADTAGTTDPTTMDPGARDGGAAPTGDTAPSAIPPLPLPQLCLSLAPLPLSFTTRSRIPASEDIAFDAAGYLVTFDDGDLVRIDARGNKQVVLRRVVARDTKVGALRPLPSGDFLIGDYEREEIARVDASGTRRKLTTLTRPSRIIPGPGGKFYISDFSGLVVRLDVDSGAVSTVAKVDFRSSGIAFSLDHSTIYVSDLDSGGLYRAKLKSDGSLEPLQLWIRFPSDSLDGMVTDECGNLYVASYTGKILFRATPAGRVEIVARMTGSISTAAFGVTGQGFDARTLYVNNLDRGGLFELKLGVRAALLP